MATADDYAAWIVQNADKKGTPDFETVAAAYQDAKGKPAAVTAGESIREIPRQLGLTARYGLEGLGQAGQVVTEPIRQFITDPILRAVTPNKLSDLIAPKKRESAPLGEAASQLADWMGLPKPQTANERTVGDAARLVAGVGGMGAAGAAAKGGAGLLSKAGEMFSSNLGMQSIGAAGAGGAAGSVREAGGGPVEQMGAAVIGGLAAPLSAGGLSGIGKSIAARLTPNATAQQVEQQLSITLSGQGIDWNAVPERVRQSMRAEVSAALKTGGALDPEATRRLLDFKATGTTPTRGMLTQDPVQITRERNLAKVGANSTDIGLQRLPQLENQNARGLLANLDDLGARNAPDSFRTGEAVIGALNRNAAASKGRIDELYKAARDTEGRSAPLNGAVFTTRANQMLDEGLLGGALPESVATHLNRIAKGEVPFTVDYAEQLKTAMGKLQRASSDGQQRMALGKVREALDGTPLLDAPKVNPGNLPAVPGTVPPSPGLLGGESIESFNRARQANAAFMKRVEQTPALQAAMDGAQPDRFVQQYITGQSATAADLAALRKAVSNDPQALQAVKSNIAAHLKSAATNGTEDVVKFSPAGFNRALNNIGDQKLGTFFSPEEIAQLRAVGRAGTLMDAQPKGSAVNNSNSGALVAGKALELLDKLSGKIPFGFDRLVQGSVQGMRQGQAMNVPKALVTQQPRGLLERLMPAPLYGGLLAAPPQE